MSPRPFEPKSTKLSARATYLPVDFDNLLHYDTALRRKSASMLPNPTHPEVWAA